MKQPVIRIIFVYSRKLIVKMENIELNNLIEKYQFAIHDLYKAYRFTHFSLYNMNQFYHSNKIENQTKFLRIQDEQFGVDMRFTEEEIGQALESGYYQRILAGNTIAMLYNLWEDNFRGKIAKIVGFKEKKELKNDVFGDLAKIRHEITHNRYNRSSKINKLIVFGYLFKNESFILDSLTVNEIVERVLSELENMKLI